MKRRCFNEKRFRRKFEVFFENNKHKSPEGKKKLLEIKNRMNTKNPKKLAFYMKGTLPDKLPAEETSRKDQK